jgi:hypothetical protein
VILDLLDSTWSTSPSLLIIHQILTLLKLHYPYRFSTLYILNCNIIFHYLYKQIQNFIPSKVLKKILILNDDDMMKNLLVDHIGKVYKTSLCMNAYINTYASIYMYIFIYHLYNTIYFSLCLTSSSISTSICIYKSFNYTTEFVRNRIWRHSNGTIVK